MKVCLDGYHIHNLVVFADLARRGLVLRKRGPTDARAWAVSLSARGRKAVGAGRRARRAAIDDVADALGARDLDELIGSLVRLSDHTGAMAQLLNRELRPEDSR